MLDDIVERILALPTEPMRRAFARALQASLKLDKNRIPPRPDSAGDIAQECGIDLATLLDTGICLSKSGAMDFLAAYGMSVKESQFKRKHTAISYQDYFGREVTRSGDKTLVFTRAEVQHWTGFGEEVEMPRQIVALLD